MSKLSIISPVYNVSDYLPAMIDSVLAQTFTNFELILVDDGSTDGSGQLCEDAAAKDHRIRVIHKENGGVSDARNVGVAAATGDFIGFVDSDDLIEPNMYEQMMRAQAEYGADIVQCRHNRMPPDASIPPFENTNVKVVDGIGFLEQLFQKQGGEYTNFVSLWSKIYHRNCILPVQFPTGRTYEDEQGTYRICLNAKRIVLLQEEYYHYIRREDSIITGVSARKMLDKQRALRDRYVDLKESVPQYTAQAASSFYSYSTHILVQLYSQDRSAYERAKQLVITCRRELLPYLDRYQKLYFRLLDRPWAEQWLVSNEFEPIQKWIRKARHIGG